jgi:glycosyltransferase involved in cell wall biosynthesis
LGTTLASAGHRFEVSSLDSPDAPYIGQFPLTVHALGPATLKYSFSSRFIPWLRANRANYDVVIVSGIWQFHSFGVWQVLRKSNTPYVVYTHGMLDPWFKKRHPLKHLKKWMYWPWADYRVLRDAQAVLFTCEEERRLARSSFWLYRCNEVVVNYGTAKPAGNPDAEIREFFARYPELQRKRLALFMGRIHPKKGCDLLIEAFARVLGEFPDWHLVICGPDQVGWQKQLCARVEQIGIADRVTWAGMLRGEMKWGALRASEIFLLPSHQENFGIAVAEALAVGVPALISDQVNIWREIVADTAGLVAKDTLEGTCGLLKEYVEMPEDKRLAMRRSATHCFLQRFEITQAAQNLHAILASL